MSLNTLMVHVNLLASLRMIEFKKYKKSTIIVKRDGKIVELDPFTMEIVKS